MPELPHWFVKFNMSIQHETCAICVCWLCMCFFFATEVWLFRGTFINWQYHRSFGMQQNNKTKKKRIKCEQNNHKLTEFIGHYKHNCKSIVFLFSAVWCVYEWVCLIIGRNSFLLRSLLFWRVCHNLDVVVCRIAMLIKSNHVAKP